MPPTYHNRNRHGTPSIYTPIERWEDTSATDHSNSEISPRKCCQDLKSWVKEKFFFFFLSIFLLNGRFFKFFKLMFSSQNTQK